MIKVFILARAYEDLRNGSLSRKETFTLTPENVVGGAGVLQGRPYGTKVPLQEALDLMITESDNTAANLLIDRLGMDRINSYLQSHGYSHSVLRRKMMDTKAMEEGRENMTSTRDVALLFKRLYRGNCVGPAQDREMLEIYKRQTDNDSIPGDLPQGTVVASQNRRSQRCAPRRGHRLYPQRRLCAGDLHPELYPLRNHGRMHLSTKIGHKTKKIRHKKRIDVQDSSTFLTSFKLVRQTMPSIMQTRSADGRVTFPILLRRQVA